MIATRTLPSSSLALPFVAATGSSRKLLADVQDALDDRKPGGRRQRDDRPGQAAPWREDETGGGEDHAPPPPAPGRPAPPTPGPLAGAGVGENGRGAQPPRPRGRPPAP